MRRPQLIALVTIALSTAGYLTYRKVAVGTEISAVQVSGTVEAREADLGFQVSGRLDHLTAKEGDRIEPGTELAALDRTEWMAERGIAQARVDAAEALLAELIAGSRVEEVARAEALLAVAVDRREAARRDVERLRSLADQALISKQAFDHQQTAVDVAAGEVARATEELKLLRAGTRRERIAGQRAALAGAVAAVARIDAVLAQSTVTAPFAGTVTVRHREPGEAISSGTPVLTLQNLSDRWLRVYVPGGDVGRLALGQCASITADGFADRTYRGVTAYISSVAEFTPRNVQSTKDRVRLVYEVRVRIVGDDAVDLKPGLPGDVTFSADATPHAGCGLPAAVASR